MIYSTCSILQCENEEIIEKCLKEAKAKIVPITFEGMEHLPLLPTKIEGTLVVKPTESYEGFFVAKIRWDFKEHPQNPSKEESVKLTDELNKSQIIKTSSLQYQ